MARGIEQSSFATEPKEHRDAQREQERSERDPAGGGIRYDRVDGAGALAWRIVVFAIETPRGFAWLQIDGPPESWAARAAELERVPLLFRVR